MHTDSNKHDTPTDANNVLADAVCRPILNPETLIEILPFPVFIFFRVGFFFFSCNNCYKLEK